jgi:hypothetical protein
MKVGSVNLNVASVEKILIKKNPCSNSSVDDVRHNFDFGKPIRVDVQDSQSSGSVIQVPEDKVIFQ